MQGFTLRLSILARDPTMTASYLVNNLGNERINDHVIDLAETLSKCRLPDRETGCGLAHMRDRVAREAKLRRSLRARARQAHIASSRLNKPGNRADRRPNPFGVSV